MKQDSLIRIYLIKWGLGLGLGPSVITSIEVYVNTTFSRLRLEAGLWIVVVYSISVSLWTVISLRREPRSEANNSSTFIGATLYSLGKVKFCSFWYACQYRGTKIRHSGTDVGSRYSKQELE